MTEEKGTEAKEYDVYRDSLFRYLGELIAENRWKVQISVMQFPSVCCQSKSHYFSSSHSGYTNELGESFRPLIKKSYVHASYGVAIAYVFADTADKSYKSFQKDQSILKAAKVGGDVVLWQILASVSSSRVLD